MLAQFKCNNKTSLVSLFEKEKGEFLNPKFLSVQIFIIALCLHITMLIQPQIFKHTIGILIWNTCYYLSHLTCGIGLCLDARRIYYKQSLPIIVYNNFIHLYPILIFTWNNTGQINWFKEVGILAVIYQIVYYYVFSLDAYPSLNNVLFHIITQFSIIIQTIQVMFNFYYQ